MAEYIDKRAIRDALYDADAITMKGVELLNKFPVADVVDVVRCKDCKHLFEDNGCPLRYFKTHLEDDFCSYGERKTDG